MRANRASENARPHQPVLGQRLMQPSSPLVFRYLTRATHFEILLPATGSWQAA